MKWSLPPALVRASALPLVGAALLTGCGSDDDYANEPRPPAPIQIGAVIGTKSVSVSPSSFGAGPVILTITNQTGRAQQVTFESAGRGAGFTQQTGPINPNDTATIKADVPTGDAVVKVAGDVIRAASVKVGAERPSAQDELLQP